MSKDKILGRCEVCGTQTYVEYKFYEYDIDCECHKDKHVERVVYCKKCTPTEPKTTRIALKTEMIKKLELCLKKQT